MNFKQCRGWVRPFLMLACVAFVIIAALAGCSSTQPPVATPPAPLAPAPTPMPAPAPVKEIDTIYAACGAVSIYLNNLARTPQAKRFLAEYRDNMWTADSCVVVVDYNYHSKLVYIESDYEDQDVKQYVIQHIFDSDFDPGTEMLQQVLKSDFCFRGCGSENETMYPVEWVVDRQTGAVTPSNGNALRVEAELMN